VSQRTLANVAAMLKLGSNQFSCGIGTQLGLSKHSHSHMFLHGKCWLVRMEHLGLEAFIQHLLLRAFCGSKLERQPVQLHCLLLNTQQTTCCHNRVWLWIKSNPGSSLVNIQISGMSMDAVNQQG